MIVALALEWLGLWCLPGDLRDRTATRDIDALENNFELMLYFKKCLMESCGIGSDLHSFKYFWETAQAVSILNKKV